MLKRTLRTALGIIFLYVFLSFLLMGALKFRVLSPEFFKTALAKGDIYKQLHNQVTKLRIDLEKSLRKETGGRALPPQVIRELAPLLSIDKTLNEERFKDLIETNIDRLFSYLNSKNEKLILYLPVTEWKLPISAFGQPELSKLTAQTPVEKALPAFGLKPEQVTSTIEVLSQVKTFVGFVPTAWFILFALVLGIGIAHFFLGTGLADKIKGTAGLALTSGLTAALMGFGTGEALELVGANSNPPMPSWGLELGKALINGIFGYGATIGVIMATFGAVALITVIILTKLGKIKDEKETLGLGKRILSYIMGAVLAIVILAAVVAVMVAPLGIKINFKDITPVTTQLTP